MRYLLRKPQVKNERDALCLNMWLDENDMVWDKNDRNIYTAHEIAQIVPLVNKNKTYEKFLYLNKWILNYWPNAVKINSYKNINIKIKKNLSYWIYILLEPVAYWVQYLYMRRKITRETVTYTRAIFHPNDWGKKVLTYLKINA